MFSNAGTSSKTKRKVPSNASLSQPSARRLEPNRHALFSNALERQHRLLQNSISDLMQELDELNMTLASKNESLDNDRWAVHMELERIKSDIANPHLVAIDTEHNALKKQSIIQCEEAIDRLLAASQQASDGIQVNITKLRDGIEAEPTPDEVKVLPELRQRIEKSYRGLKMSEIDLEAQSAAVSVLEKEVTKLNGLPQVLPILKSSIKDCEQAVKKDRSMLVQLDRQRLTPAIAHIASESLTALEVGDGMNQTSSGADQNEKYDKIIQLLVEQAATNQLFLYILELEEELLRKRTDHQRALLLDIEKNSEHMDTIIENFQGVKSNNYRDDDEFLKCVEQLLKTQIGDLVEPVEIDMAAPKQLERLKKELSSTTHRIQTSLRSMNDMMLERYNSKADMTRYEILILTTSTNVSHKSLLAVEQCASPYQGALQPNAHIPEETQQLHVKFENFIDDLQSEIQRFQKETTVNAELAEKKRRFALFWTEPGRFEQEFGTTST
ncbi:hypothetical protein Unana1_06022 [Umbelopsis nana]